MSRAPNAVLRTSRPNAVLCCGPRAPNAAVTQHLRSSWALQVELASLVATDLQAPAPPPAQAPVAMAATRVVMHQLVMPAEVDTLGICFGGQVPSTI